MQILMNVPSMEVWVHVNIIVPTQLAHSTAAAGVDTRLWMIKEVATVNSIQSQYLLQCK